MSGGAAMQGFKHCDVCGVSWPLRGDLLSDPSIKLVGYQVNFTDLVTGLLLFDHVCGTTLAISVLEFRDLYDGPIFQARRTGEEDCPGYCLHAEELRPCPATCECAFVREIVQIVRQWPKEPIRAQVSL
jgi:hypothetical protein